jgi:hypothetical protein
MIPNIPQYGFAGGMNLYKEDYLLAEDEYRLGFNVRCRTGGIQPVYSHVLDENAPAGLKQGLYGFGQYLLLFVAGLAYYRTNNTSVWTQIAGFEMDDTVQNIYIQAVPASTFNFNRKQRTADEQDVIQTSISVGGTVAGLVCQDGINQPWIILPNGTARELSDYSDWDKNTNREYVPVGKQMCYIPAKGILLVASSDSKQIYRSVSGRPLDFVVNIDLNGDKAGNAATVSFAGVQSNITCLSLLNTGEILIGTSGVCTVLSLDYDSLIFGEPTYITTGTIGAGVLSQTAFLDILGDYAFVDSNGLRSFNAVQQLRYEGNNSVFSQNIASLLKGITQTSSVCACVFDNYALFGVNTIYGNLVIVYDTLSQKWISLDSIDYETVKFLAVNNEFDAARVFAVSGNNVYELYADTDTSALAIVQLSSCVSSSNLRDEVKLKGVRAVFLDSMVAEDVTCTFYVNDKRGNTAAATLTEDNNGILYPTLYPIQWDGGSRVNNVLFGNLSKEVFTGFKTSCVIRWSNSARLVAGQYDCDSATTKVAKQQQIKTYAS